MKRTSRGFLLVVEGIDGSGKTTLMERLAKALAERGQHVLVTKEPGGTPFGKEIRQLVQHSNLKPVPQAEFLLFAADRAQHIQTVVAPALAQGTLVVSDRMADSSMAYQGHGRGVDRAMIELVNHWAMAGLEPDLVLYVKVDWQIAWERICKRGEALTTFEQEKKDFFERVAHGFDSIFSTRSNAVVLDGALEQDALFEQAWDVVMKKLS